MRVAHQFGLKIFSFVFLCLMMFCTHATPETLPVSSDGPIELFLQKSVTQFIRDYHIPGIALAIIVNGKTYAYNAGYADIEKQIPVSDKTIFDIGSLSKIMTCLLFTQEIDFAKMDLDDSPRKYLPELPKTFDEITLQELATHTASLPFDLPRSLKEHDDLIDYLSKWSPSYTPGNKWIYSNVGIGLLGYTVERKTVRNFDDLYWRHITSPLKMRKIGTVLTDEQLEDHATGYDKNNQAVKRMDGGMFPEAYGLKMSAEDMQRFLSAAVGFPDTPERIFYPLKMTQAAYLRLSDREQGLAWQIHALSPSAIKTLLTATDENDMGPSRVREIYERAKYNGNALIDKTGSTNGFQAYIAVLPNKKSGIAILMNKQLSNTVLVKLGREILFKLTNLS
jgi:beta-lactamase class C